VFSCCFFTFYPYNYKKAWIFFIFTAYVIFKMKKNRIKRLKAFTLTELLVVLVIIGILVLLALPNLMPLISKAKSTEAQLQLEHVQTLEKTYFYLHSKYSTNLSEINYEPAKLVTQGGNGNYLIEVISASNNAFKARATAVTDFDGDGVFNIWEVDQDKNIKEVTPD
jgi:type IV pilus assembly protein PilE